MTAAKPQSAQFVPLPVRADNISRSLGLKIMELPALMRLLARGLPWSSVVNFINDTGLSQQDLVEYLGITERTFARRRQRGNLDHRESERLVRLAEIYEAAVDLFDGNRDSVRRWLTSPARGLGKIRPIKFAQSEFGAREVRNLIGRLQDGVFS